MIGYVDYGKIMFFVVILKVFVDKYLFDINVQCDFVFIDLVLEECQCGIIINILYIEYEILKCYYVYVDVFGYVDYVKNMIIGVVQMDGVIFVVVVIDGLMVQMCEYVLFVKQVGVLYLFVVLNKFDMVDDEEILEFVEFEVCELFVSQGFFEDVFVVCVFVFKVFEGDEKWVDVIFEFMQVVDDSVLDFECDCDKLFLMFVEDVFMIIGCGIVVMGCVECGILVINFEVEIVGLCFMQKMIVIGIEMFYKQFDEVWVGENCGLLFCGIKCEDVECGQVVVKLGLIILYMNFEGIVYILLKDEGGCYNLFYMNYCLQFYFCIIDVIGVILLFEGIEMVMFGDIIDMLVELIQLIVMEEGFGFVICEGGCIVGVGMVMKIVK